MAAMLVVALGAGILCTTQGQWSFLFRHESIQQLQQLPENSVAHLVGVVIYADEQGGQYWVEDKTGAVPIALNPGWPGIHVGDTISIEARKVASTDLGSGGLAPKPGSQRPSLRSQMGGGEGPMSAGAAAPPDKGETAGLSITDAAPEVRLTVIKFERNYMHWLLAALFAVMCLLAGLFMLLRRIRLQEEALSKASDTTHAIADLSTEVQRLTQEAAFNCEISVRGVPEVAPLAEGFNAMLLELQRRDRARKEAESRLQHMSLVDELTGLPNRRLLSDRLSQCLARARRDQRMVALLCIDLDGFKLVNDSFGHSTGDALLGQVAQRLKARFRQSDTLARIGGDEFALILDHIESRDDAQKAAEIVLDLLKETFQINGRSVRTSAGIGIGIFPDGTESGQLLQQADCAMFAAKRVGKSRIVHFGDDLGSAARERLTLEGELQNALAKSQISVHYQPEFDLATKSIVRFEALARWTHPELGPIVPVSFIPIAEESGLIIPLGAHIMERACRHAVKWQEVAGRPVQAAVNVSSVQFARDSFFEEVADVLHRTGLQPNLLQIEITESATVTGIERAADMMRRLKRMGVSVAVDDFGTGYSCLNYLPKLPFDALKLDRSFLNELMVRREPKDFVQSILMMARNLRMKTIVEGIEKTEQLNMIRKLGIDEAQGYLLGRASQDPEAVLRQGRTATEPQYESEVSAAEVFA
jgi:diguanylate cyclase (GGDEF)-like protein